MNEKKTTDALDDILKDCRPETAGQFLAEQKARMAESEKPFAAYMRKTLRHKKIRQQDVFLAANISEGYGYKLISEEKHTVQRDVIIRLCLAAHFTLNEAQRALKLYGMSELYSRVCRDAVLIIAFNSGVYEIDSVDDMLVKNGFARLYSCAESE